MRKACVLLLKLMLKPTEDNIEVVQKACRTLILQAFFAFRHDTYSQLGRFY